MSSATQNLAEQLRGFPREKLARLRQQVRASSNSGHALLAEALKQSGLRRIYGVPGVPVDQSFAECAARSIRPIAVANQQAAVFMAAAENYLNGRLEAAVLVSAGPAVANTVTGILVARDNGWPVLVLGGRRALGREGIGEFQELDAVPLLSPVAKLAKTVRAPAEMMSEVFAACATAQTARRGPVYLDLPEDVLEGRASSLECGPPASAGAPQLDLAAIGESVRLLVEARRPLLIIGEDVRWTFNGSALRRLVDEFGIPFITSPMGRGFLPDDHPICGNRLRRQWQGKADLVIMAGAWFDWRFRFGAELADGARIIHADSDPATLGKNVQARVLFLGEPGQFLSLLAEALGSEPTGSLLTKYAEWQEVIKASATDSSPSTQAQCDSCSGGMSPQAFYSELADALPDDAIIALEGNVSLAAGQRALKIRRPASWLDPGRNGIIGAAIPFAMGAKLAFPGRPSIALCSDTGFGMSAMNLEAAVRHHIPITVVVANNDGNCGALRQKKYFPGEYPERFSEFLPGLRYEQVMEMFGGHAEYVSQRQEVRPALARALASGLPACLNVRLDPHAAHLGAW